MHPVYPSTYTGHSREEISVPGDKRQSEATTYPSNKAERGRYDERVDEIRLSSAVRKIMASADGSINSQSAALLASKVASSDPELASQAFGRIMSEITFNLLSHTDRANEAPERHAESAQARDTNIQAPKLNSDSGELLVSSAADDSEVLVTGKIMKARQSQTVSI